MAGNYCALADEDCALGAAVELPSAGTLVEALVAFDGAGAHAALDRVLSSLTLESVLRDSVLPALRDLGERWKHGEITIGQEHFASNAAGANARLGARLGSRLRPARAPRLPRGGTARRLPDHVRARIARARLAHTYLGADTPLATIDETAITLRPDLIVVAAVDSARLSEQADALHRLATRFRLALAGAGAGARGRDRPHPLGREPDRGRRNRASRINTDRAGDRSQPLPVFPRPVAWVVEHLGGLESDETAVRADKRERLAPSVDSSATDRMVERDPFVPTVPALLAAERA